MRQVWLEIIYLPNLREVPQKRCLRRKPSRRLGLQLLPGIGVWRFTAWPWENLIQLLQHFSIQYNFRGPNGTF